MLGFVCLLFGDCSFSDKIRATSVPIILQMGLLSKMGKHLHFALEAPERKKELESLLEEMKLCPGPYRCNYQGLGTGLGSQ